ncbi:ABC transporter permease [bacterium E08(2017)]|nr:ABC transporter permease [bacterium E08(2017)]
MISGNQKTFAWLFLAAPAAIAISLFFGSSGIGIPDLSDPLGRSILELRFNRVIQGFFVGAALSCAGVIFQAILRNPLAEPYILGVSSGAGLGAAFCILSGVAAISTFAIPVSSFFAAAATLLLVFMISRRGGAAPSIYSLILSGVIISAICSSILMFLVSTASSDGLHTVVWWMLGNLQPSSGSMLILTSLLITAGCAAACYMARDLNAITLGSETAYNVGVKPKKIIISALAVATMITASAVSISGLIGFVGLIVPHVVRSLVGTDHKRLVPAAAVAGGAFLSICDAVARSVMAYEIPVGVITAVFGGPFFLAILMRRRRKGWIE